MKVNFYEKLSSVNSYNNMHISVLTIKKFYDYVFLNLEFLHLFSLTSKLVSTFLFLH